MRDTTPMFNRSGEHVATIRFNESCFLWQILVMRQPEIEFFCLTKDVGFAAWHEEFDPESGFPKSAAPGIVDA
jgi:hypothetical protein